MLIIFMPFMLQTFDLLKFYKASKNGKKIHIQNVFHIDLDNAKSFFLVGTWVQFTMYIHT